MMRLPTGFHPGFDALSAHADRSDTEAARTTVGRHVVRCAACRTTVEEIRALGTEARTSAVPVMPDGLWTRIERRMDDMSASPGTTAASADREVSVTGTRDGAVAPTTPAPIRKRPAVPRTVLGLLAILAVVTTVLALDSRDPLVAATARRLTTEREFARPGARVTVHYRPIPALADRRALTLWRIKSNPDGVWFDVPLERAATLRRVSALEFTGTVVMPDTEAVVSYIVGDSTGEVMDRTELRNGFMPVTILAADAQGRPRLDAFVAALGRAKGSPDRATQLRWATKMRELYPTAPETWILAEVHAWRGVVGDIVRLFESRERKYYTWHDRLEHRAGLSEATETMMANIGWELMDTARAEFWTTRLLKDHPASEWLPGLWIRPYRDVPDDSAAIVLRAFEPIYSQAKSSYEALSRAITLAERSGDSTLIKRWELRIDPRGMSWLLGAQLTSLASDPVARADIERRLREALVATDSLEHAGPTLSGLSRRFAKHQRDLVQTRLAALKLIAGDAEGAKAALDTLVRDWAMAPSCPLRETMRWRAEASRRLGRMSDARADLAYVVVTGDWRAQVLSDSAPTLLGPAYSKASWDSALADANAMKLKCWGDSRAARQPAGG